MVNKKGYLKTLEAVIAIVIILLFTFAVTPKPEPDYSTPYAVKASFDYIIDQVETNDTIRSLIMQSDTPAGLTKANNSVKGQVQENIPPGYDFSCNVCDMLACLSEAIPEEKSVYSRDVLISSDATTQNPKVVRIWMWSKGV